MTNDAVRLLIQLARTEREAGRPLPESIGDQLLQLVETLYEATPAARKRRSRVAETVPPASRERDISVPRASHERPASVTSASRQRDISVPQAAALGRGVGGMGVVVVEQPSTQNNSNSALQKEAPSLDDLILSSDPMGMTVQHTTIPASVQQAQQQMAQRMAGVTRGNARRQRFESMVELVFGYWRATYTKPATVVLGSDRRRVILRALTENDGNLSELFFALDGARKDDWIMGRDPRSNGRYDTPETILKDRAAIERHAGRIGAYGRGEPHPEAAALLLAMTDAALTQLAGVA